MHAHHSPSSSSPSRPGGMLASLQRNGLRLALFAIVCTALIVLTDFYTRDEIVRQNEHQLQLMLGEMLPAGSYDNNLAESCVQLVNKDYLGDNKPHPVYVARKDHQIAGYVIDSVAPAGYAGAIRLLTAVDREGKVARVQVLEHHETPGLGDKIERSKSSWIDGFNGHSIQDRQDKRWAVRKDGGEYDSFTGATITPRAVVKGVRDVLLLLKEHPELINQAAICPPPAP